MNRKHWNITDFLNQQLKDWDLARLNYENLKNATIRQFQFSDCLVEIQFNPERIRSTVASQTIKKTESDCFLCEQNRPSQQKWLPLNPEFDVLCNPYPVFSQHLTIASHTHIPQTIQNSLDSLLYAAKSLPEFVVFYNGAHCGASTPEHLHFQAGIRNEFPLYKDYEFLKNTKSKKETISENTSRYWIQDDIRRFYSLESSSATELISTFQTRNNENVNLLCWYNYSQNNWVLCVFERKKHRPDRFYASGREQLLISPASVEMAGKIITAREEDFHKITQQDIIDIFEEILN